MQGRKDELKTQSMPTFANRPSTIRSFGPVDIPQSSLVGQQRQQISELQFDKFPTPSSFLCWKIRFRNQVTACSDFPSEAMLWIKEVEMIYSMDELEMDASELHARKLNAKEVLTPMEGDNFTFPVEDGTGKLSGGDQNLRT